ncbi:MAG: type II toxin-antitoxin system RelE/ParE family toxin [Acidimicrobiaceae bacterium]|nr:type II toxin-antitoxin system RelE/ParE family toxin [Acidimicrobiaceae bacterium]MXW60541.1 type II toxin-antitoxin system RelE/ParE family toxin [Acidimicrobiaceae bacterium]MXW74723.1 type II toxin-antitoxin system RelE/ParE family toxin [Acidimicrobiaceae bacterium]MYA74609.1 type II toxin-antitoxin system RelE/ParE family toxin [Acidimicrobiaceae bacterium]MYC43221.1 type II toxin-antitoxin system RelE/ParE family toxin [Acidimicrobiaceae bacterium]
MSRYSVEIARRAIKSIAGLPPKEQRRIQAAIDLLANEPRPPNCVALSGEESVYRVRVGDYRILYEVIDTRLLIHVIRVGHCRDVYRPR